MLKYFKGNIYGALILRLLIIFVLYTFCRAVFLVFNIDSFTGLTLKELLIIFLGGLKFDLSAILYTNSLFIVSQIIPFQFTHNTTYQKVTSVVFYICNGIALGTNIGDVVYYPFTLKRTTFTVFSQFKNEDNISDLFLKFAFIDYWYISLLFVVMLFCMIWSYKKIKVGRPIFTTPIKFHTSTTLIMLVLVWVCVAGMRGGFRHSTRPITLSNAGEFVQDPAEINIVINSPFSIIRTIKTKPIKKVSYFNQKLADSLYNPLKTPNYNKAFNKKNVVVIILESFSREYIGAFNPQLEGGKYKGYAPFLDSLKSVSLSFNNAYANGRKSIEGLPSVIASIPGIHEPFVLGYYSANKINSLGGLLGAEGYHTSFFHGAPNGSMGFSSFINLAGIKNYYGKNEYQNDTDFDGIWGIWDEPFLQFWAKKLNTFQQPFFSTIFTLSSHHPFKVSAKYEGKFPKGTLPIHQNIGYTDMALRKYFETVSKADWYKNTLFIFTADHSTVAYHDEYKTSIGAFAVPIIIFDPSGDLKGQIEEPVQQIDIMPTILNYLHYNKSYFAFGNDMLQNNDSHFLINTIDGDYQIMMGDYVMKFGDNKVLKLFNYRKDTLLRNDLKDKEPEQAAKMEKYVKAFIQQYNKHMVDNSLVTR